MLKNYEPLKPRFLFKPQVRPQLNVNTNKWSNEGIVIQQDSPWLPKLNIPSHLTEQDRIAGIQPMDTVKSHPTCPGSTTTLNPTKEYDITLAEPSMSVQSKDQFV